MFRKFQPVWTG